MTWVRWQLPSCVWEPCSTWSRQVCPSLLPQQCPKPAFPLLGNNGNDPSSVHPCVLSVLCAQPCVLCSQDGCGWGTGTTCAHVNPPCQDPSLYLVITFVFSRGKELNFELQLGYFLLFLGHGGSEGVYLLFQRCQLLLPRGQREEVFGKGTSGTLGSALCSLGWSLCCRQMEVTLQPFLGLAPSALKTRETSGFLMEKQLLCWWGGRSSIAKHSRFFGKPKGNPDYL